MKSRDAIDRARPFAFEENFGSFCEVVRRDRTVRGRSILKKILGAVVKMRDAIGPSAAVRFRRKFCEQS